MTLYDTLKSMIIAYPLIFPSKLSMYNHLFLTIGNDYKWKDGELISIECEKNYTIEDGLEKLFNDEFQYSLLESYLEIADGDTDIINYIKRANNQKFKLTKRIINFENIINEKLQGEEDLYPLSKYSAILNIPHDIKEDWKLAIQEFLYYIMNSKENKIVEYREKYKDKLSQIYNNLK